MNEDLREAMRALRELTERVRRLESTMAEYRSETQRLQQELANHWNHPTATNTGLALHKRIRKGRTLCGVDEGPSVPATEINSDITCYTCLERVTP